MGVDLQHAILMFYNAPYLAGVPLCIMYANERWSKETNKNGIQRPSFIHFLDCRTGAFTHLSVGALWKDDTVTSQCMMCSKSRALPYVTYVSHVDSCTKW